MFVRCLFIFVEHQQELARLFERTGRLSVSRICEQFGISETTARRDPLIVLAVEGGGTA